MKLVIIGGSCSIGVSLIEKIYNKYDITNISRSIPKTNIPINHYSLDCLNDEIFNLQDLIECDIIIFMAAKVNYNKWKPGVLDKWNSQLDKFIIWSKMKQKSFYYIGSFGRYCALYDPSICLWNNDYTKHKQFVYERMKYHNFGIYYTIGLILTEEPYYIMMISLIISYQNLKITFPKFGLPLCTLNMIIHVIQDNLNISENTFAEIHIRNNSNILWDEFCNFGPNIHIQNDILFSGTKTMFELHNLNHVNSVCLSHKDNNIIKNRFIKFIDYAKNCDVSKIYVEYMKKLLAQTKFISKI